MYTQARGVQQLGTFTITAGATGNPITASCNTAAGEVFGGGSDAYLTPTLLEDTSHAFPPTYGYTGYNGPTGPLSAVGDLGTAVKFIASSVSRPNGFNLTVHDESSAGLLKDVVISTCPHNFTPVNGNANCKLDAAGYNTDFALRFGGTNPQACNLAPGATYYINFRDHNTPRGTVSTQFVSESY